MEPNHFSHHHGLVFHHLPQSEPSHHLCSACKSPATSDVYTCRQCNFFLHQECFMAPRSLHHPSHPLHPLTLMPFPTYPSRSFICNSCNLVGDGVSYTCCLCEFDIHLHCSRLPHSTAGFLGNHVNQQSGNNQSIIFEEMMQMARRKKAEEEAYVREMEMEEELRRRRHNLAMQRLQQASDSIDFFGSIK